MRAIASGLTDVGLQRDHNEDSYAVLAEYDLFIVADGMGGHRAGDVASRLATDAIAEFFRSTAQEDATWPFHFDTSLSEDENRLVTGIRVANRRIYDRSIRSRDCAGMGTTVVGALYSRKKNRLFVGHVGDSRAYRVRGRAIQQLTRDHSLINDYLLAMPELTEEQRAELPKNVITRALGMQDSVAVDLVSDDPQLGDVYLLCSDGLSGMLSDDQILGVVSSSADTNEMCRRLIQTANDHGGEDNITALVIRFDDVPSDEAGQRPTQAPPEPAPESKAAANAEFLARAVVACCMSLSRLVPCSRCRRHVVEGASCPFCARRLASAGALVAVSIAAASCGRGEPAQGRRRPRPRRDTPASAAPSSTATAAPSKACNAPAPRRIRRALAPVHRVPASTPPPSATPAAKAPAPPPSPGRSPCPSTGWCGRPGPRADYGMPDL